MTGKTTLEKMAPRKMAYKKNDTIKKWHKKTWQ